MRTIACALSAGIVSAIVILSIQTVTTVNVPLAILIGAVIAVPMGLATSSRRHYP